MAEIKLLLWYYLYFSKPDITTELRLPYFWSFKNHSKIESFYFYFLNFQDYNYKKYRGVRGVCSWQSKTVRVRSKIYSIKRPYISLLIDLPDFQNFCRLWSSVALCLVWHLEMSYGIAVYPQCSELIYHGNTYLTRKVGMSMSWMYIYTTIWIVRCTLGVVISSITTKPYILQKFLFQWICCKCLAW